MEGGDGKRKADPPEPGNECRDRTASDSEVGAVRAAEQALERVEALTETSPRSVPIASASFLAI